MPDRIPEFRRQVHLSYYCRIVVGRCSPGCRSDFLKSAGRWSHEPPWSRTVDEDQCELCAQGSKAEVVVSGRAGNSVWDRLKVLANSPALRIEKARGVAQAIKVTRAYRWVGLYDVTPEEVVAIAWTGPDPPAYPRFPVTKGLTGAAVATRESVVVQDVTTDDRYLTAFSSTRAEAIFPVAVGGRIVGTIDVESDRINAFGPEDVEFLKSCALVLTPLWM